MVVTSNGTGLVVRIFKTSRRQRSHRRPIDLLKDTLTGTIALLVWLVIELLQDLPDLLIEFRHAEEVPMSKPSQNPGLQIADAVLYHVFISGLSGPCRDDGYAVEFRPLPICGV